MRAARFSLFGFLLVGCSGGAMNLEVASQLTDELAPLYDHSHTYLDSHVVLEKVDAIQSCDDQGVCLLEITANSRSWRGPAQSLLLNVAVDMQALPGNVDLLGVYQYGLEPVVYSTTEEVDVGEDAAARYDYVCTLEDGWLNLEAAPAVGERLDGSFELTLDCVESLAPDETVPTLVRGRFGAEVRERSY